MVHCRRPRWVISGHGDNSVRAQRIAAEGGMLELA
jgi:hypothetical protein